MANITVPLFISYDTKGLTPVADIIAALEAASIAIEDAVSLIPSLKNGVGIEASHIHVRSISQESPLREIFAITLVTAFQDDLKNEIPPLVENMLGVEIPDQYDSIVTVATMIVIFYGASFLKEAAVKAIEDGALRRQVRELITQMSAATGKSEEEVKAIFEAKYSKPGPVKRLAKAVRGFFVPSQREGCAPITFDRKIVGRDVIRDVPFPSEIEDREDFERYKPYQRVSLDIHAQDRDKKSTGWAAVPEGITVKRLKMKLVEPVSASELWNRDRILADIVLVSKLTSEGYAPSEIHLTRVY